MKAVVAALVLAVAALPAWARGNISHFVDKLACESGPYALKLPKTYNELRKLGTLKAERLVREEELAEYKARHVDLIFNGLRLGVVTYSNDPEHYQISSAEIRSSQWRIAPFRTGQPLPPRVGDVETKSLRSSATVEFSGEEDTLRVKLSGRRVSSLTYLCIPD
ncbi:MAG TPA: hypothetical protein VE325_11100 [Burkholderiales bacterium]|nr:hypothetical protein [Burkholderiales bacterium]